MPIPESQLAAFRYSKPGATPAHGPLRPPGSLCRNCGYDCGGLPVDRYCPECGTGSPRLGTSRYGDAIREAPPEYLAHLRWGTLSMAAAAAVMIVAWPIFLLLHERENVNFAFGLAGALWFLGVYQTTRPRKEPEDPRRADNANLTPQERAADSAANVLRVAALLAAATLLAGTVAFMLFVIVHAPIVAASRANMPYPASSTAPSFLRLMNLIGYVGVLAGLIGIFPVTWAVSNVALWAQDDDLAHSLRVVPFWFGLYLVLAAFGAYMVGLATAPIFFTVAGVVCIAALGVGLFILHRMWLLANLGLWAARNQEEAKSRDLQREKRIREKYEKKRVAPPPRDHPKPS